MHSSPEHGETHQQGSVILRCGLAAVDFAFAAIGAGDIRLAGRRLGVGGDVWRGHFDSSAVPLAFLLYNRAWDLQVVGRPRGEVRASMRVDVTTQNPDQITHPLHRTDSSQVFYDFRGSRIRVRAT